MSDVSDTPSRDPSVNALSDPAADRPANLRAPEVVGGPFGSGTAAFLIPWRWCDAYANKAMPLERKVLGCSLTARHVALAHQPGTGEGHRISVVVRGRVEMIVGADVEASATARIATEGRLVVLRDVVMGMVGVVRGEDAASQGVGRHLLGVAFDPTGVATRAIGALLDGYVVADLDDAAAPLMGSVVDVASVPGGICVRVAVARATSEGLRIALRSRLVLVSAACVAVAVAVAIAMVALR